MIGTGIKKELMLLTRKGKLIAIIAIIIGVALMDPFMMKVMQSMMDMMPEMYESIGSADETVAAIESMSSLFGDLSPASLTAQCSKELTGSGTIVLMFVLMSAAGGEQKKRSVIIPRCSGLTPTMYVAPKFIIYPLLIFVCSLIAMFLGAGVSLALFEGTVDFSLITMCAVSTAIFMAFIAVLQLTIGLSTGMPGVAVVSSIVALTAIPSILASFRVDRFNPFALCNLANNAALLSGGAQASGMGLGSVLENTVKGQTFDTFDFTVSVIVTVIISVMLYLTTVFFLAAKKLDNTGDEPLL